MIEDLAVKGIKAVAVKLGWKIPPVLTIIASIAWGIYEVASGVSVYDWAFDKWHKSPASSTPAAVSAVPPSVPFPHQLYAPAAVFAIGVGWLTLLMLWPKKAQVKGITAKFVRTHFYPSDWVQPFAMDIMQQMGRGDEVFTFDLLFEIFLVNEGPDVTVKTLRAEAEVSGKPWTRLKQVHELNNYELKIVRKERTAGGMPIEKEQRVQLDNLMDRIDGIVLKRGIGYRGWLRFQIEATKREAEQLIHTKLWIVDALGNEHGVTIPTEHEVEPSEGELVHSLRHLRG